MFQFRLSTMFWAVTFWGMFLFYLRLFELPVIETLVICAETVGLSMAPVFAAWIFFGRRRPEGPTEVVCNTVPRETTGKVDSDDLFHVKRPSYHGAPFHVKRADY